MHFEIKDTELELIEKTAIEEDVSLDSALRKLLFLGRDIKRDKDMLPEIKTQALEGLLERLDTLDDLAKEIISDIGVISDDINEIM